MAPAGHYYFTLRRVQMLTGAMILWALITKSKRLFWAVWSKLKLTSRKSHSCRAGIKAKSSVSWTKAYPTSCLTCHIICTQLAPAFAFHLKEFKFKPWFLCQNVSQLAIDNMIIPLGICSHTGNEIWSAEGNVPVVILENIVTMRISYPAPKPSQLTLCSHEWSQRPLKSVLRETAQAQDEGPQTMACICAFCH